MKVLGEDSLFGEVAQASEWGVTGDERNGALRRALSIYIAHPDKPFTYIIMSPTSDSLILAVNAGSSSLKLALFAATVDPRLLCTWSVSEIGSENVRAKYSGRGKIDSEPVHIDSHVHAFERFLKVLDSDDENEWKSEQISHICHRVVHGGSYTDPVQIDKSTLDRLTALSDLAPLYAALYYNIFFSLVHNQLIHLAITIAP